MKKYITILIMITCHHSIAKETHESAEQLTCPASILNVDSRDIKTTTALLQLLVVFFILYILCTSAPISEAKEKMKIEKEKMKEENGESLASIQYEEYDGRNNTPRCCEEELKRDNAHILEEKRKLQEEIDERKAQFLIGWQNTSLYPVNVSLDPDTAHPNLILSEDRRRVTWEEKPRDLPDDPQRFVSLPCVLGQQVISSGRRYWEVEVGDIGAWDLGICRDNVMRKGRVFLKPQDGFWAIRLYNNEYWALTSPETQLTPKKHPARVCIFLEYEDRRISFYNMTDKFHIHTFNQCLFYGSLRPFFRLWSADSGHLTICPVSETAQPDDDPHRVPTPVLGTSYNLPD